MVIDWIQYVIIVLAAVLGFAVGGLWYSPLLFAKRWMKEVGFSKKDIEKAKKKGMAPLMIGSFLVTLLMSLVLYIVGALFEVNTFWEYTFTGFMIWIGFIATTMLNSVLYEGKSLVYYAINAGHYFFVLVVMSIVYYIF